MIPKKCTHRFLGVKASKLNRIIHKYHNQRSETMNRNISFQHKEYLVLRDLIRKHAIYYIEDSVWDNEWALPIMRDFPHEDDYISDIAIDPTIWCTFDWAKICNYEWALPVIEKNLNRVSWEILCRKDWAIHLIKANPDKVVKSSFFANPTMIDWIVNHMDEVDYNELCFNPAAMRIIENMPLHLINWSNLCENSGALVFLEKHITMIDWEILSKQEWALPLLTKYVDSRGIDWYELANKPWAISLIENNLHRMICYSDESLWRLEENPAADRLFLRHRQFFSTHIMGYGGDRANVASAIPAYINELYNDPTLIDWDRVESNPAAIHLILERFENGHSNQSEAIWSNPSIITYNYQKIKEDRSWLQEAIVQHFFHPKYIEKWLKENPDKEIEEYNPGDL